MRVELVDVAALLAADIALPRVGVGVTALVQEIERLIRKCDAAVSALQAGAQPLAADITPH